MLDAYIIDDIRRRPQREQTDRERLRIELPYPEAPEPSGEARDEEEERGPIVIPLRPDPTDREQNDDAA